MKYSILFILLLFQSLFSQINWASVYGDTLSLDEGWYISKTNDGNYIVSGMEHYTAVIKKINSSGELIWSKTYDNPTESDGYVGDDVIKSVRQVSDGGYIAVGYFEDEDSWSRVSWIFKTDESGEVLWSKTYTKNNSTDTWAEDVIETTDGGFVITGNNKNNGDRAQAMLRKYDDNGELVWHKTYSRSNYNEGISLIETNEGDIVFVGFSGTSHGAYKHFIVKTDSEGNSLFKKRFGTNTQQSLNSVIEALGGGYIATGYCNNYNDLYIVKFDTGGSILWEHCIPANQDNFYGWDHGNDIIHSQSGGYYIVGTSSTYPQSNGGDDIYLVKIDDLGDTLWTDFIGGTADDQGQAVVESESGDLIIVGTTWSYTTYPDNNYDSGFYIFSFTPDQILHYDNLKISPSTFHLGNAYPNPFNPQTKIQYTIEKESNLDLYIHDLTGKRIKTLFIGHQSVGSYINNWNGDNNKGQKVSAGLYFYTIATSSNKQTKKLILIK